MFCPCGHARDIHYGSERDWCNTQGCECQGYADIPKSKKSTYIPIWLKIGDVDLTQNEIFFYQKGKFIPKS